MTLTSDTFTALAVIPAQRTASAFDGLRSATIGAVLEPGSPAYEAEVAPWNLAVPVRPAAVVAAACAADVVEAVRFGAEHGLSVGVQATGHGAVAGHTGTLLVSTRGLDECTVSPQGWARVGAGVKWVRVIEAAAAYGLAPLNGSTSDVGVVGYTTGGGLGPMARTFGLASDRVRAIEVVTGDGVLRRATPTEHPELFFALRGGKGAVGIVTAIEFDLVPLATFYGGALYFDGAHAPAVLHHWRRWSADLPEQATTSVVLLNLPPLPTVPPPLAGKLTVGVRVVWTGDVQDGEDLLAPMRAAAPVLLDGVTVMPYAAIDAVHADPVDPMPATERSALLAALPEAAVDALLALAGPGAPSPQVMVEIRQLGGAIAVPGTHPSAFCQRAAAFSLLTAGIPDIPGTREHAAALMDALAPWATGGQLPNFAPPHDSAELARCYDSATVARLRAAVAAYDPAGVLALGRLLR